MQRAPALLGRAAVALVLLAGLAACTEKRPSEARAETPAPAPAPAPAATHGVAIVFEAHHMWLGNTSWWGEGEALGVPNAPEDAVAGFYPQLGAALDAAGKRGAADTTVALISYGDAAIQHWTGPLSQLGASKLPAQRELTAVVKEGRPTPMVGMNGLAAIDQALRSLEALGTTRKTLILIGDSIGFGGPDDLAARLAKANVTTHVLHLRSPAIDDEDQPGGMKLGGERFTVVRDPAILPRALEAALGL